MGVGAAAAREFAKTGANLVLVARGVEALEKIAQELSAQTEVMISALDVTDYVACQRMLDSAHDRFGRIDVLVNNAGMVVAGSADMAEDPLQFARGQRGIGLHDGNGREQRQERSEGLGA